MRIALNLKWKRGRPINHNEGTASQGREVVTVEGKNFEIHDVCITKFMDIEVRGMLINVLEAINGGEGKTGILLSRDNKKYIGNVERIKTVERTKLECFIDMKMIRRQSKGEGHSFIRVGLSCSKDNIKQVEGMLTTAK
jgi:hypothetical protein